MKARGNFFTLKMGDSRACFSDDAMVKRQPESTLHGISCPVSGVMGSELCSLRQHMMRNLLIFLFCFVLFYYYIAVVVYEAVRCRETNTGLDLLTY